MTPTSVRAGAVAVSVLILAALLWMLIPRTSACYLDRIESCRPPGLPAPGSYSVTDSRGDIFGVPEVIVLGVQR